MTERRGKCIVYNTFARINMLIDQSNKINEFEDLAEKYDKFRPDYPDICYRMLQQYVDSKQENKVEGRICLDVGCGTGIATRKLYKFFSKKNKIIGIEPCEDMIIEAKKRNKDDIKINYIKGRAEELDFNEGEVECIIAAQAIQWFDRKCFYKNAHKVLCKNGVLAIMENNRNWRENDFLNHYEELLEQYNPGYNRGYRDINFISEIGKTGLYCDRMSVGCEWSKKMTFEEFFGMSSSSTKVKQIINQIGEEEYRKLLKSIAMEYEDIDGMLEISYETQLFLFTKRS